MQYLLHFILYISFFSLHGIDNTNCKDKKNLSIASIDDHDLAVERAHYRKIKKEKARKKVMSWIEEKVVYSLYFLKK